MPIIQHQSNLGAVQLLGSTIEEWNTFLNTLHFLEPLLPENRNLKNAIQSRSSGLFSEIDLVFRIEFEYSINDYTHNFYTYILPAYICLWKEVHLENETLHSNIPDNFFLMNLENHAPDCYRALCEALNKKEITYDNKNEKFNFCWQQNTVSQFFKAGKYTEWGIITNFITIKGNIPDRRNIKSSRQGNQESIKKLNEYYPQMILDDYFSKIS